jgi:hypothetical protein
VTQFGQDEPTATVGGARGGPGNRTPNACRHGEKFVLIKSLLNCDVEVRTLYKRKRIIALERADSHVVIRYEDGGADKIHIRDFGRRRFVAVI